MTAAIQCGLSAMGTILAMSTLAMAQQGDRKGEAQPPLPADLIVPESPPLSAMEALDSFAVASGLRVELVAAEPLVIAPVTTSIGLDGRIWVVEMPGYMSDVDGSRELEPSGRIVILSDEDQDGAMDTRTVFLDELALPRAVKPVKGGALVVAPPNLLFAEDHDGDGTADETTVLDSSFQGLSSPEHAGNGLRYGMDNWLHCSQHPWEYQFRNGEVLRRRVPSHGQWGLACDEWDRWYYTPNSYPLMVDLIPKHIVALNPDQRDIAGLYRHLPADKEIHSIRINPGVNRGYRPETLNDDFTLRHFTAACGPAIYLDHELGDSFQGDAFICEPSGNTVEHRNLIHRGHQPPELRTDPEVGAALASTDERFRPVNVELGSDGSLYISDLYRGILQHKIFMTSFLRKQVLERELDQHVDGGRIWRLVPDDDSTKILPDLSGLSNIQLAQQLTEPNATRRLLAQQHLVSLGPAEPLRKSLINLASTPHAPLTRAHALWTLHARGELEDELLHAALQDPERKLQIQALRIISERDANDQQLATVLELLLQGEPSVRWHAAAALARADSSSLIPELAQALNKHAEDPIFRTVVVAIARGDELLLLQELAMSEFWMDSEHRPYRDLARSLIRTAARSNTPECNLHLLEFLASLPPDSNWVTRTAAQEIIKLHHLESATPRSLQLAEAPFDWEDRLNEESDQATDLLRLIDTHSAWPGRPGYEPNIDTTGLNEQDAETIKRGAVLYAQCTGCHQADGNGLRGFYPPLSDSPYVIGSPEQLLAILIHGLEGPIEVDGMKYDQPMPPAPFQSDQDLADIASFLRNAFDNEASMVSIAEVEAARTRTSSHSGPLTAKQLHQIWPR
ncbi:MAG: hypothetical protein CMJ39_07600 [Phycisphaerae bacterium]|nr:hypothetical protein [Phycisphaerae bacterium]